ncbi:hypothetical protein LguiB_008440 [Lonicera macranthoides]
MMNSGGKKNLFPPGFVNNLQDVLNKKGGGGEVKSNNKKNEEEEEEEEPSSSSSDSVDDSKPILLVTNGDGSGSPGLTYLVQALVSQALYNVHVCAPQSDKSMSGHSLTHQETVAVTKVEIDGAIAFEVSGTPVDCVSLALSGALFSWSKPVLVISGVNKGSSCGHNMFYSGVVAGAKEALINGVPSISVSLNWKKDESKESDFKDAVSVCLPLINAAMRDIEKGIFPKSCLLNIEIPTAPSANKGFKVTRQSLWRPTPNWQAITSNRHPAAGRFMSNQQALGMQLAQLSRDASAAGAARRSTAQKKVVEVESVGVSGKSDSNRMTKYFRLEFLDKEIEGTEEDLDFRALENGFVAITPLCVSPHVGSDTQTAASDWISAALKPDQ